MVTLFLTKHLYFWPYKLVRETQHLYFWPYEQIDIKVLAVLCFVKNVGFFLPPCPSDKLITKYIEQKLDMSNKYKNNYYLS